MGVLALAGFALVGFLVAWAPDATAQVTPGGDFSGVVVGRAALSESPHVESPHSTLRVVGVRGHLAGAGEFPQAKTSLTAIALHTLAGAKWMLTRHIGLFFDYKFRTADPSFSVLNNTSDLKHPINYVFGGVAVHF